ncbi:acyl-CoA dehydrogenase [Raineyella sp. LH-20]|uniref:acyl-CoA dehydrogenase family protein n=1 Tax=Raineyella sp. LH-20 TaxID=3081204 RepID=UPI0029546EEB|nr:acyl-CoA dehydrogenase [Raineyella sp. LH-20]WOP18785.1 acyl-CoA dehydrogenase [Raineyella sp. LH-20]
MSSTLRPDGPRPDGAAAVEAYATSDAAAPTADVVPSSAAPATTTPPTTTPPLGQALVEAADGPFHVLRERLRREVLTADLLRDPTLDLAAAREWTTRQTRRFADSGCASIGYPHQYGGTGDASDLPVCFGMLGYADLSFDIKVGVQFGLFAGSILTLGGPWHRETYLRDALAMRLPGAFAMTELGHGSDVQHVETTIRYLPATEEYEIDSPTPTATKAYIGNAARDARMAVVFGRLLAGGTDHGVHAVLVPIRDEAGTPLPGVTIGDHGHKGGLLGVDNGTLRFDHVRVPRRLLLDRFGGVTAYGRYRSPIENRNARFFTMVGTLVRGRISVGGSAAAATRRSIALAARYALRRRQFPVPGGESDVLLLDYLTHQRRLLPRIAEAYAYGFAQNELLGQLRRWDGLESPDVGVERELETRAAALKAAQTRWAVDTVQAMREACGGAGFMTENVLTQIRQDVDVFVTFEGDNTVLQQLVAKELLVGYRAAWGDLDLLGMARVAARTLGEAVLERTAAQPLIARLVARAQVRDEEGLPLERGWQVVMFEDRERHILESLAHRAREAARARPEEAFAALNALAPHMLAAARAHTDRLVLEAFIAGIDATQDGRAALLLDRLCDLYVMSTLEADRGWFLEHHRITPTRSKEISARVDALCGELRPYVADLVEGFGIPEVLLDAPMVRD